MKKLYKALFAITLGIFVAGIASASIGEYWSTVSHIIPRTDVTVDIGSATKKVREIWTNKFYGDYWISATNNSMNVQPTGDTDDFFSFKTPADRPTIKREGGKYIYVESSNVNDVGISFRKDADHSGTINYYKDTEEFGLTSKDPLVFKVCEDYDDYIKICAADNVPELAIVGAADFKINAGGANSLLLNHAGGNVAVGATSTSYILGLGTGDTFGIGTTQWNSADEIDGTKIKDADYGDVVIDATGDWQVSEATALAANGANCGAGEYALGVDASGAVESCTDATTEINTIVATKDECSEITNCVPSAWDALTDMVLTDTYIYVGNVSNDPVGVSMSSDCTLSNTGVITCDHDALDNFVANEHLDWTADLGATNIHSGNYTDTNTTYVSSDFTHDDLTGFVANEHLDWTTDLGAVNLHAGNYTDTNTTYTAGTGLTLTTGAFSINTSQNIATLSNLTTNGFITTSGGTGLLGIDTNTYLTGNQTITLSGDVTGSGATAITTTIGADKILESHLKAVDAAADEECLTYEATTGDFEWQTCGGSLAINDITDITITTPADNEVLAYNNGTSTWLNQTPAEAGLQGVLTNSAGLLAALSDETGTGLSVFSTSPTFTTGITVPNDSISAAELNEGDAFAWTSTHDFGGATSLEIPNGAAPTVNAIGEIALDTTSDQLVYYGSAKRVLQEEDTKCFTIESLAAADDNMEIFMADDAVTITAIGLHCAGTCTTGADISLEDRAGNAMTHTVPTHSTGSGNTTFQAVTAANTLVAGEGLRFDVDNAVSPETDTYLICFKMKYTSD